MLLRGRKNKDLKSGILLALSSLPSPYGIGDLGEEAYRFIDFLKKSRQSYWQFLPLCPVGKGNSPYSSYSSFAGEILYISIDLLVDDGYLKKEDIPEKTFPKNTDYEMARDFKLPLLKMAAENFDTQNTEFEKFKNKNGYWLKDYSLFMAISEYEGGGDFSRWCDELKYRQKYAITDFKINHKREIEFFEITQFFFYCQFERLKQYAFKNGIKLIGDIPFYVSFQSADVWSNPLGFRLGNDLTPVLVAGVPPDVFSKDGQLWGNPIYDWEYHKKTSYNWWKNRLLHNAMLYDVIRIDHFRAFNDYYTIPFGAETAKMGRWEKGVGMHFWDRIKPLLKDTEIIAEDLGGESEEVKQLIINTGFPNMSVLQFAFDSDKNDPFLPKNMSKNSICYTGTHDNDTTLGWYKKISNAERIMFEKMVPKATDSVNDNLILFGMKSHAKTVIVPLQDYLCLDSDCRMNMPGKPYGNWEWRFCSEDLTDSLANKIRNLSKNRNKKI